MGFGSGAPDVVLGSHRWEEDWYVPSPTLKFCRNLADKVLCREPTGHELTSMAIPPGACWLLHGSTVHRGGGNSSKDTHRLLGASWTQGHMRQEENQYLAIPKEEAMKLPEETQRLIGYKINAPMG
jgi:ectoine hydroxylase-related dioxygenase (phytanoyl-CoA dioxygenase family)